MLQSNPKLNLVLEQTEIVQVEQAKLLGVMLDRNLSWSTHINDIIKKMGRGLVVIRRCADYLTETSVRQVIQALVLAHLDYCAAVWSGAAKKDIAKLQIAQNKAARLALKCRNRTNVIKMHESLSWSMVEQRLMASLIWFFF